MRSHFKYPFFPAVFSFPVAQCCCNTTRARLLKRFESRDHLLITFIEQTGQICTMIFIYSSLMHIPDITDPLRTIGGIVSLRTREIE